MGSGKGIGPFRLLSHVGEVLQDILERTHDSRDVLITYDPKEPLLMDLEVELPEDGIRMRFDPKFQRMKIIEVFDLSKANFICEKSLASVGKVGNLSHRAIISRFGMTFPGVILLDSREYILEYPGLSFSFPLPKDCDISLLSARERLYNLEEHIKVSDRIRLDSIKIDAERFYASKMFVYSGKDFLEFAETHSKILEKTREICQVHSGKGVYFPQKDKWIDFECSSQDILADFGSPSDIVQKPGKFIFNYFHLGIDVVFESGSSDVKKVVLHTNLVSRPEFNR